MDGLECSEIRMSDVCDTTTLRFDSDYYKKEYLEIEQFICKNRDKFVTIESQGLQVDASAFYPSLEPYYNTGTIPFVRVADVKDQIEYNACVNIPEMGEEFRTLHMCYPGDVVLTKGGRVGTAGLITQPSYVTRDLIFINASALSRKDYIVLYLFFSSSFAYKQMVRSITESDFVTLFIKTWFTFIAVLRELNPDVAVFTEDGMPRGDKPFLNAYKEGIMPIVQKNVNTDDFAQELFAMYPISMRKVMDVSKLY